MPADHGGGLDDQHDPDQASPVKATRQHSEDHTNCGCEGGSLELSSQNEDLMAQRQDLGVALVTAHQQQSHTGNQKPEQTQYDRGHSRSKYRPRTL